MNPSKTGYLDEFSDESDFEEPFKEKEIPLNISKKSAIQLHFQKFHEMPKKGSWIVKLNKLIKCADCNKYLENSHQLLKHQRENCKASIENRFRCDFCKNEFQNIILLRQHIKSLHIKVFYENLIILKEHLPKEYLKTSKKSEGKNTKENSEEQMSSNENKCGQCGKTFCNSSAVRKHVKTIHEGFKFKCDLCQKEFRSSSSLYNHRLGVHRCQECNFDFTEKGSLKRHLQNIHLGNRSKCQNSESVACSYCGKGFLTDTMLKRHVKSVHEGLM